MFFLFHQMKFTTKQQNEKYLWKYFSSYNIIFIFNMLQRNFREVRPISAHTIRLGKHTATWKNKTGAEYTSTSAAESTCNCTASTTHQGRLVLTSHLNILPKSKARLQKHLLQLIECQCEIKPLSPLPLESEYCSAIFPVEYSHCLNDQNTPLKLPILAFCKLCFFFSLICSIYNQASWLHALTHRNALRTKHGEPPPLKSLTIISNVLLKNQTKSRFSCIRLPID